MALFLWSCNHVNDVMFVFKTRRNYREDIHSAINYYQKKNYHLYQVTETERNLKIISNVFIALNHSIEATD